MNNEKGFLLFYDWLPALETLSAKDFKTFLLALIRYQRDGTPVPEISCKVKTIASFILPQIDRRKSMSELGKMGARARYGRQTEQGIVNDLATSTANGIANGIADGFATGHANGASMPKDKEREQDKDEEIDKTESETGSETAKPDALAESEKDFSEGKGCAAEECGKGYGRYGNVYLSTEEYLALDREIPDLKAYIDRFSEKLHQKGYRYASHFEALRQWWARDKDLDTYARSSEPEGQGSFDTDAFFEAAVRRSLGDV